MKHIPRYTEEKRQEECVMFAKVNGISLYYEEMGTGRPLLMVHGNGEDHTIFLEAAEVLSREYCVILIDSRSHGKSTGTAELHYQDMADDLSAFLIQMDLRDVIFYGFSDGGIIGLLLAQHNDRITDLVVSGANLTPEGVIQPARSLICFSAWATRDPKMILMTKEPQISTSELSCISARTLVLAGDHDLVCINETTQIAQSIPGAELRLLQGEDHGSYIVHSRKIAWILSAWLKQSV